MPDTLELALSHTLEVEGGYSDHPADKGGATKYGITQATLEKHLGREVTKDEVKNMTWETAKEIYRDRYWAPIRADELPPSLAILTMDVAVNSGPRTAVRNLQRAANYLGAGLVEDGLIGPKTISAVNNLARSGENLEKMIGEFVAKRGIYYTLLDDFNVFGMGWARRLVKTAHLAYDTFNAEQAKAAGTETALSVAQQTARSLVRRYFLNDGKIQTYGSFFRIWGGWATAGHVYKDMNNNVPSWATGDRIISPNFLDAALFGVQLPATRPTEPVQGQRLLAVGFPAGSSEPSERDATVYMRRSSESFIGRIHAPKEPVVVGMSGGVVLDQATSEPIGIIIERNSPADLDFDGEKDESFNFVALCDVYDAAIAIRNLTS